MEVLFLPLLHVHRIKSCTLRVKGLIVQLFVNSIAGLVLDPSSDDFVNGKVLGVSDELYMKGCIQDVADGIKVRNE